MKTLKFILTVCLIGYFSCAAQDTQPDTCYSVSEDSIFCKFYVKPWIQSFESDFNLNGSYHVTFTKAHIQWLLNDQDLIDTTAVRIYFTLPADTGMQLPGLVLVPFSSNNCQTEVTDKVITAKRLDIPGYKGRITAETKTDITNWISVADTLSGFTTIYGYNFSWDHIKEACHQGDYNLGVAFGVSDLDQNSIGTEIHMYLTEGTVNIKDRLFLDFSSPCPRMCGDLIEGQ
jgi:hypothetical protein